MGGILIAYTTSVKGAVDPGRDFGAEVGRGISGLRAGPGRTIQALAESRSSARTRQVEANSADNSGE
jgi:hypothetical protein